MSVTRKIDKAEMLARECLVHLGFSEDRIIHEPDGNIPPDLLVEKRIAVEVRRLNQHWQSDSGDLEPTTKLSAPLLKRLEKLLADFGAPTDGRSWYVIHRFQRPQLTKKWEPILRQKLAAILEDQSTLGERFIYIDANFQ